ncbi:cytochrome P450 [Apiospora phragmitis]|uniref:Cytochrome P450 n=1 Tax=Apiospora phragmitis TaxID=2905665 RepID=A0ABR1VFI1_9PEZI
MEGILARPVQAIAVTALLAAATYLYRKLYRQRLLAFAHLPQHPSSLFWGHLRVFDEFTQIETCRDVVNRKLLEPGTGEDLIRRMTYISAIIKEMLRLYPPTGSVCAVAPGSGFVVSTSQGDEYNLDGTWVYLNNYLIQRDCTVFGETADEFVPERWLQKQSSPDLSGGGNDGDDDWSGSRSTPVSAWRAFERGPRNCIGQELANIEARVILASVARRYDFTKFGIGALDLDGSGGPVLDDKGR